MVSGCGFRDSGAEILGIAVGLAKPAATDDGAGGLVLGSGERSVLQKSSVVTYPVLGSASTRAGHSAAVMTQNRHCRQLGTRPGGTSVARRCRMLVSRSVSLAQFRRPWALGQLSRTGTSRSWNVLR